MEQDDVKINLNNVGTKTQLFTFRTTCNMQQKNVKQFQNIKPKLAVCPKRAVRSQIRINREYFFSPTFPKMNFEIGISKI